MVDLPFTKAICKVLSVVQMQSFLTIYKNVWIINEKRVSIIILCVIICSVKLVTYTVVVNKVKAKGEKNRNERCNF